MYCWRLIFSTQVSLKHVSQTKLQSFLSNYVTTVFQIFISRLISISPSPIFLLLTKIMEVTAVHHSRVKGKLSLFWCIPYCRCDIQILHWHIYTDTDKRIPKRHFLTLAALKPSKASDNFRVEFFTENKAFIAHGSWVKKVKNSHDNSSNCAT